MNILEKEALMKLIEEYGDDRGYQAERAECGTYGEWLQAQKYTEETLAKIRAIIEGL
ncbi:hypothetical protein KNT87_gp103 [Erwinia phage Cronus]|uniref:Uncharacterized protein n=1 Tax=Erwinia phage Cronus TaxID=2163633 RepID=A0A2S1GMC7_9CAUD|nr:hypothetical protein KNT87_gp103 [Erwinia phage Cronus]AWD90542.1 hypothetical protein [Erwinia phage Cronus]